MRIAMFSETFLPSANGVTTSIATARQALRQRGHHVKVFAAGDRGNRTEGVTYYGGRRMARYPDFHFALAPAAGAPNAARVLRQWGCELAHLHSPGPMGWRGWWAAGRTGIPYVYTYHTHLEPLAKYAPAGTARFVSAATNAIQDQLVRRAACMVVPSHFLLSALRRENPRLAQGAVVVPTGVDTNRFHPAQDGRRMRPHWGIPDDAQVILYLGRLGLEKRVDLLITAFARLAADRPNAHLVLAGRGPARDALARQVAALGLGTRVHFTGFVAEADLPAAYAAADAFASASDFETQGLTLLEAMATGVPCAVAAAGGYLDPVRHGHNSYLFTPHDADDAARAIAQALDAPAEVRRQARAMAHSYRIDHCMRLLERTYEAAAAGLPVDAHHTLPVPGLPG